MKKSRSEDISTPIFCSVFGHNYVRKGSTLCCKNCQKEISDPMVNDLSGAPESNDVNTLLRYLMTKSTPENNAFS